MSEIILPIEGIFSEPTNIELGKGLNSSIKTLQKSVVSGNVITPDRGVAPILKTGMFIVENTYNLTVIENIKVSAKASYAGFGGAGSYASNSYYKINNYSVYLFAYKSVEFPPEVFINEQLNDEALYIAEKEPDNFYRSFGNYYASSFIRGGYYIVMYEFNSENETQKKDITAKLKVTAKAYQASASAEYQKSVQEIRNFQNTKIVQEGILDGQPTPNIDLESLISFMNDYNTYLDYDKKNRILFYNYSDLNDLPYFNSGLLDNGLIKNLRNAYNIIDDNLANYTDWLSDIDYVSAFIDQFEPDSVTKSLTDRENIIKKIEELENLRYDLVVDEKFKEVIDFLERTSYDCAPYEYVRKAAPKPPVPRRRRRKRGPWTKLPRIKL